MMFFTGMVRIPVFSLREENSAEEFMEKVAL